MQCGCPVCGAFMGKAEKGLKSECVCPQCGFKCRICIGKETDDKPAISRGMSSEEWESLAAMRGIDEKGEHEEDE